MVYIVVELKYPSSSAEAAGKAFFKAMKDFSHLYREGKPAKRIIGLTSVEDGNVATTIWEVTDEYLKASQEVMKLYLALSLAIEGSKLTTKTCLSVMESLPIIGMSPPT